MHKLGIRYKTARQISLKARSNLAASASARSSASAAKKDGDGVNGSRNNGTGNCGRRVVVWYGNVCCRPEGTTTTTEGAARSF